MPDASLGGYVLAHHSRLMTPHERAVHRHLTTLFKQRDGPPPAPGTAADTDGLPMRMRLSDDPRVMEDANAGWDEAGERIARRILRDHPDEVSLNRCPACAGLTQTPTARLCLHCGHSWYHVPRDQRL